MAIMNTSLADSCLHLNVAICVDDGSGCDGDNDGNRGSGVDSTNLFVGPFESVLEQNEMETSQRLEYRRHTQRVRKRGKEIETE